MRTGAAAPIAARTNSGAGCVAAAEPAVGGGCEDVEEFAETGHGIGDVWFVAEVKEVETAEAKPSKYNY